MNFLGESPLLLLLPVQQSVLSYPSQFTLITVWLHLLETTATSDLKAIKCEPLQKSFVATSKRESQTKDGKCSSLAPPYLPAGQQKLPNLAIQIESKLQYGHLNFSRPDHICCNISLHWQICAPICSNQINVDSVSAAAVDDCITAFNHKGFKNRVVGSATTIGFCSSTSSKTVCSQIISSKCWMQLQCFQCLHRS